MELKDAYEPVVETVEPDKELKQYDEKDLKKLVLPDLINILKDYGLDKKDIENPTKANIINTILMLQENNEEESKPEMKEIEKEEEPEPDPVVEEKVKKGTTEVVSKYTTLVPDLNGSGERSMQDMRNVWALMKKVGIGTQTAQEYIEGNFKHYVNVEGFCSKATVVEVVELLEYHVK